MGLVYEPGCQEFLRTLAPGPKKALRRALDALHENPYASGLDLKVLRTRHQFRFVRCRVQDYRIVYTPRAGATIVWRIMHRSEGYAWLTHFDP